MKIALVMAMCAGFLAASLALWNGCLGRRADPVAEASGSLPRGSFDVSDNAAAPETSEVRMNPGRVVTGTRHASRPTRTSTPILRSGI